MLNVTATFSADVQQHIHDCGISNSNTINLKQLAALAFHRFTLCPPADLTLSVHYELQDEQHTSLGTDDFTYDHQWLSSDIQHYTQYWLGLRAPDAVLQGEQWKCKFCNYLEECKTSPLKASAGYDRYVTQKSLLTYATTVASATLSSSGDAT